MKAIVLKTEAGIALRVKLSGVMCKVCHTLFYAGENINESNG